MSIQPLLAEETKDVAWSNLYCHSITAGEVIAPIVTTNGLLFSTTNVLTAGSFAFTVGAGTPSASNLTSSLDSWQSTQTDVRCRRLTFSVALDAVTSPAPPGPGDRSNIQLTMTLPQGASFFYPTANGNGIGVFSITGINTAVPVGILGSAAGARLSATQIVISAQLYGDLSVGTNNLTLQGTIGYEVVA